MIVYNIMYLFDTNYSRRNIFLNSKHADMYLNGTYKSSLFFYFNEIIYCPNYVDLVVKVQSCSIPISIYNIDSNNNKLYINNTLYTIPVANYSVYQLRDEINDLLTSASIFVSYSSTKNKYTFTSLTSDFTINSTSTILEQIGFSSGSHTSSSYELTSDQMIDLSGVKIINFCTNLNTPNIDSYSKGKNNVLQSIPITVGKYGVNTIDYSSSSYTKVSDKIVSYLLINIYDEDFNYINFNNVDWCICIEFSFVMPKQIDIPDNPLIDTETQKEIKK